MGVRRVFSPMENGDKYTEEASLVFFGGQGTCTYDRETVFLRAGRECQAHRSVI